MPRAKVGSSVSKRSTSIPEPLRESTEKRIQAHAQQHFAGKYTKLEIRFHGQLCYIDCYMEPSLPPGWKAWIKNPKKYLEEQKDIATQLCRLRYLGEKDCWGFELFTYSNERYEPSLLPTGDWRGTPEEAFDVAATLYLS